MERLSFNLKRLWYSLTDEQKREFAEKCDTTTSYIQRNILIGVAMPRPPMCEAIASACEPYVDGRIFGEDVMLWAYRVNESKHESRTRRVVKRGR